MMRLGIVLIVLAGLGLSFSGCTNTIRGLGKDVNSEHMQNYNSRTATNLD